MTRNGFSSYEFTDRGQRFRFGFLLVGLCDTHLESGIRHLGGGGGKNFHSKPTRKNLSLQVTRSRLRVRALTSDTITPPTNTNA